MQIVRREMPASLLQLVAGRAAGFDARDLLDALDLDRPDAGAPRDGAEGPAVTMG